MTSLVDDLRWLVDIPSETGDERALRDAIAERVGATPVLAGSGATWFADGEHANALADLVDEGARVVVARTVPVDVAADRGDAVDVDDAG